jgi:hypothetical protein
MLDQNVWLEKWKSRILGCALVGEITIPPSVELKPTRWILWPTLPTEASVTDIIRGR